MIRVYDDGTEMKNAIHDDYDIREVHLNKLSAAGTEKVSVSALDTKYLVFSASQLI